MINLSVLDFEKSNKGGRKQTFKRKQIWDQFSEKLMETE